jgi:hypothetical protein
MCAIIDRIRAVAKQPCAVGAAGCTACGPSSASRAGLAQQEALCIVMEALGSERTCCGLRYGACCIVGAKSHSHLCRSAYSEPELGCWQAVSPKWCCVEAMRVHGVSKALPQGI